MRPSACPRSTHSTSLICAIARNSQRCAARAVHSRRRCLRAFALTEWPIDRRGTRLCPFHPPPTNHALLALGTALPLHRRVSRAAVYLWPTAQRSNMPDRMYVTDGDVNAISRVGDTIYIGGSFQRVGLRIGPGAEVALTALNKSRCQSLRAGPRLRTRNRVCGRSCRMAQPVGMLAALTHVGGIARANIAHILGDDSVDPAFNAVVDGGAEALRLVGLYAHIVGAFSACQRAVVPAMLPHSRQPTAASRDSIRMRTRKCSAFAVPTDGTPSMPAAVASRRSADRRALRWQH